MLKLATIEIKLWVRSKAIVGLVLMCIIISATSVLSSAHSNELLGALGQSDIAAAMPDPGPTEIKGAVFKNLTTIGLIFCSLTVSRFSAIPSAGPLQLFYVTNGSNNARIFLPKILVSSTLCALSLALGVIAGLYYAYISLQEDNNLDIEHALKVSSFYIVGAWFWFLLQGSLAVIFRAPIISAIALHIILIGLTVVQGLGVDMSNVPFYILIDPISSIDSFNFLQGFLTVGIPTLLVFIAMLIPAFRHGKN